MKKESIIETSQSIAESLPLDNDDFFASESVRKPSTFDQHVFLFETTPSVKSDSASPHIDTYNDRYISAFKKLLQNTKTSYFPMMLMYLFLSKIPDNSNYITELYRNILKRLHIKKTLLVISSMRVIDDLDTRNQLLHLLSKNKHSNSRVFKSAVNDLKEYWN